MQQQQRPSGPDFRDMERGIVGLNRQMLHIRLLFGACGPSAILYPAPCLSRPPRLELAPPPGEESPAMAPGEVAEWSNAPHSKCGIGASLSGVRIPPSPPRLSNPSKIAHSLTLEEFSDRPPVDTVGTHAARMSTATPG